MIQFEINQDPGSIIKVVGVGGGGSNAVNHMFKHGITGVDFIVCNTDIQALEVSPVPIRIQLGASLTRGLGAGAIPEMGKNSAIETRDEIRKHLADGTQMVFITAGLGGGTGTGAAPIIASVARELGILTVGIVTMPFAFEGKKRKLQAEQGLEEMKKHVDTLLVICNDKLREIYGNLKMSEAFEHADNVLTGAARSIAEIISVNLHINVDFNDVKTVMKDSGVAIMGTAQASGERRAIRAVEQALNSPLLNDNNITGARHVLLNITSGTDDISMDEFGEITDYIQEASGHTAELITGYGIDSALGDKVSVTIIATGFQTNKPRGFEPLVQPEKIVSVLETHKTEVAAEKIEVTEIKLEVPEPTIPQELKQEPFVYVKENIAEKEIPAPIGENEDADLSGIEISEDAMGLNEYDFESETSIPLDENADSEQHSVSMQQEEKVNVSDKIDHTWKDMPEMTLEIRDKGSIHENVENAEVNSENSTEGGNEREERIRLAQERIKKLKEMTLKLKSPEGLLELEKEPSFVRQNIKLDDTRYSTDSQVSRFSLNEGEDQKARIKSNNSFLHDAAD